MPEIETRHDIREMTSGGGAKLHTIKEITGNTLLLRFFYGSLILFAMLTAFLVFQVYQTRKQTHREYIVFQEDILLRSFETGKVLHAIGRIQRITPEAAASMTDVASLHQLGLPVLANRIVYPEFTILTADYFFDSAHTTSFRDQFDTIRDRFSEIHSKVLTAWRAVQAAGNAADRAEAWKSFRNHTGELADIIDDYNTFLSHTQGHFFTALKKNLSETVRNLKIYFFCLLFLSGLTILITFLFAVTRRRSEKLLLESRAHYRSLSENSIDCIVRYNPDLRVIYANGTMSRITGLSPEDLPGTTHREMGIPDPLAARLDHLLERVFAEGAPRSLQFDFTTGSETITMDWRAMPEFSDRGDVRTVMAVSRDITALVKSEMELRKTKSQLQAILDHSPALIAIRDPDGRILLANRRFGVLGHDDPEGLAGKSIFDLYPEDIAFSQLKTDHEVMETGETREIEEIFDHADGTRHDYFTIKFPLYSPSKSILGVCGISTDISTRKKAEAEKTQLMNQLQHARKMEAIGTLVGGIAHDFNNLLGVIIGNTELAMDEVETWHPAGANLSEIRTAGMRARQVVRQLLGFTRKSDPSRWPMDVRPVVRDCLELIRASLPATVVMETDIEETLSMILADKDQIHQMLVHLCNNAAQAMETTGGTLTLGMRTITRTREDAARTPGPPPGTFLRISVADTGHGIPEEIINRIFDPYFTTREFGKGGGMGLSIVHGIVKGHDGVVQVSSELGSGTVVNAYFPVIEEIREADLADDNGPLQGGTERILFVDDEISMARMGQQILERLGYAVTIRSDPEAALEDFKSADPGYDLVITDMTMPRMTGDILAGNILTHRPDTPIILCTGHSERIDAAGAEKLGIRLYLEKPIHKKTLARSVRQVLDADRKATVPA